MYLKKKSLLQGQNKILTLVMLNKLPHPLLTVSQSDYFIQIVDKIHILKDKQCIHSTEANWSGSTLFSKAGHIQAQQDQGKEVVNWTFFPVFGQVWSQI